jgi:Sec-independent protein translocase protein TatA
MPGLPLEVLIVIFVFAIVLFGPRQFPRLPR